MGLPLKYHWRNLFVRKSTTVLTVLVVAAVVGVLTWMLSFGAALRHSLATATDTHKLIVLKRGATAESNSAIRPEDADRLAQIRDIEKDPATGLSLLSRESLVQVQLPRIKDGGKTFANVAVRGVTEDAFKVHRSIRLINSRRFSTGTPEVIVGVAAAKQFIGLGIGQTIQLGYSGSLGFVIVGYFSADGGPMESEIWAYLPTLMNSYNRTLYSSVNLRVHPQTDPQEVIRQIEGPAIQLAALAEPDYWRQQSRLIRIYLTIGGILVTFMCLAAIFSIANTMYSAVAGRTREIAMLRTVGFRRRHILLGFVIEAVLLSLLGGIAGCLACFAWLRLVGNTKDMFGANTFTTLAFEIPLRPAIVAAALAVVAAVGAAGAILPALRASRVEVVSALREA